MLFIRQMILLCLFLFIPVAGSDSAPSVKPEQQAIYSQMDIHHPVWAKNGMVATQEALATQIGVDILKQGGNAVDAAIAVGYALAVTLPRAGNLGGGGFMLLYLAEKKQTIALDYREKAPAKATADMYLDKTGNVINDLSRFHGLAVGTPGTVMGLELAREKYASMSRATLLAPAIKLAAEGITVTADLANSLKALHQRLTIWESTKRIFYKADGGFYQAGEILQQKDLANSLKRIAEQGAAGFYQGYTAQQIAGAVAQAGGIMSIEDLNNYQAIERQPVIGTYRGYDVISMPPPSSGGVHIVQMLNMLETYPLEMMGHNSAATLHIMTETMRRAYADRSLYLGDSDFVDVPVEALTDKKYAQDLVKQIDLNKASLSSEVMPGKLA
ncbi:MAG: gamma-glutamyltransferase, partial [Psychromonas sp.]